MELNYKLTQTKKILDKMDELKSVLDFIEGGVIKELKDFLKNYIESPDNDTNKNLVETELKRILDIAEVQKKA